MFLSQLLEIAEWVTGQLRSTEWVTGQLKCTVVQYYLLFDQVQLLSAKLAIITNCI